MTPSISVVDASNRGKGALLKPIVENGEIRSIEIAEPGIDYNPLTTSGIVVPIGSGFVAEVLFNIGNLIDSLSLITRVGYHLTITGVSCLNPISHRLGNRDMDILVIQQTLLSDC